MSLAWNRLQYMLYTPGDDLLDAPRQATPPIQFGVLLLRRRYGCGMRGRQGLVAELLVGAPAFVPLAARAG